MKNIINLNLQKIQNRIKKENEVRYGISIVDLNFLNTMKEFELLIEELKKYPFVQISENMHITFLRCKSVNFPVNVTNDIETFFDEKIKYLNEITLFFHSISLDDDGVIRINHNSNIKCKEYSLKHLNFKLISNPWASIGRLSYYSYMHIREIFELRKLINKFNNIYYEYSPDNLKMILFKDILFNNIIELKQYNIKDGFENEKERY